MVQSWCSGIIVVFMIALTLQKDLSAVEMKVINEADEFVMKKGDPLKIKCISHEQTSFEYPKLREAISSPIQEEFKNGLHTLVLNLSKLVYNDTGLYGCRNSDLEIISPWHRKIPKSYVYIYVYSNDCALVNMHLFYGVNVTVGGSAIIPCKPTLSDCRVELYVINKHSTDNGMQLVEAPFNPRIGFTLANLTILEDQKRFYCETVSNGTNSTYSTYVLSVVPKDAVKESRIINVTSNCFPKLDERVKHYFRWKISQQGNESVQFLRQISSEYGGCYQCNIRYLNDDKITKKCITIHDPEYETMEVETQGAGRRYNIQEGGEVQWTVYVDISSPVEFKWLNTKGEEIVDYQNFTKESKYVVISTYNSTTLKMESLKIEDEGVYTVQANYSNKIESLNFTLNVSVKPVPVLKVQPYYAPNQTVEIFCDVVASPKPNITWNFIHCRDYFSCEEGRIEELKNLNEIMAINDENTAFSSTLNMVTKMGGKLSCTACNRIGCYDQAKHIMVSDVGNFGITASKDLVVEGDDLELTCFAISYNHTNNFRWTYERQTPIEENSRVIVTNTTTQFSYRSILTIKNVTKADSISYGCANRENVSYDLLVHDGIAPYFNYTNLNGSEPTIILATGHQEPIILKCFVAGLPKPKVSWYKDDEALKIGGRYKCSNDCQEFHINNLWDNDNGKYSCHVENRFGKLKANQTLIVQDVTRRHIRELVILVVVMLIIAVVLFICFMIKVRREKIMRRELKKAGLMHFEEGVVEQLNPDLTLADQAEFLPYDKKWEFPREKLKLGKYLGKGAFGVVRKADAQGICKNQLVTTVAVKMVRQTTDPMFVRALATELKIMVHLGKHLNVVNLLGACTKNISKRELLVIVEYCQFGNLHDYLLRRRPDFINQIDPVSGKFDRSIGRDRLTRKADVSSNSRIEYLTLSFPPSLSDSSGIESPNNKSSDTDSQGISNNSPRPEWRVNCRGDYNNHDLMPICTQDLLSWAFQVARGMEYLSQRKVVHADLAARNILLAKDNVVKICDFGLAKIMCENGNYETKGDALLPIKWMAIEAIRDRILSTQSDIWSYGVVLWEFFTLSEKPYRLMEPEILYEKLIDGYRMEQPKYATSEVYNIMLECWRAKPSLRPSFMQLIQDVGNLLEENVTAHYIDLNGPYLDMNAKMLEEGQTDYLQMLSAPDYQVLSPPSNEYSNCPNSNPDSIYLCMSSTRPRQNEFHSPTSDKGGAVELSPMLQKQEDDDSFLKITNVNERRAKFDRQMQAKKNKAPFHSENGDTGYW